jgi:hypothetical protein
MNQSVLVSQADISSQLGIHDEGRMESLTREECVGEKCECHSAVNIVWSTYTDDVDDMS